MAFQVRLARSPNRFGAETLQRRRVTIQQRVLTIVPGDGMAELLAVGSKLEVRSLVEDAPLSEGGIGVPVR